MIISQILVIAYWLAKIFMHVENHGKQVEMFDGKPLEYNVVRAIFIILIDAIVLYYGGFWDCLLGRM